MPSFFSWAKKWNGVKLFIHMLNLCLILSGNVYQSGCTILHSHQQYIRISVYPHPHQCLLLFVLFKKIVAILVGVE
jgi:hypothetical protein